MLTLKAQPDSRFEMRRYFTRNGRAAFSIALKLIGAGERILVPAYIGLSPKEGSGVFDPISESGSLYDFYAVDDQLSPVMADLERKIARREVKAVLVIHYFGFPPHHFDQIVALCKKHGKILIEDCAHAFDSYHKGQKLGTFGDIAFYSIHKYLPIERGGILSINNPTIAIPDVHDDSEASVISSYVRADLEEIRRVRRDNFAYLNAKRGGIWAFFENLPEGVVPLNFPIRIEKVDRNDVYTALQRADIPTSSIYHTLIPQIVSAEYPISHAVSRSILNLPIHQTVTHAEIDHMIDVLHRVLSLP